MGGCLDGWMDKGGIIRMEPTKVREENLTTDTWNEG